MAAQLMANSSQRTTSTIHLLAYRLLSVALFTHTLGAYNLGFVPLSWVSTILFLFSSAPLIISSRGSIPPHFTYLLVFLLSGLFSLGVYAIFGDALDMPTRAGTSYPSYLALRIATVLSYTSAFIAAFSLVSNGYGQRIVRLLVKILIFVLLSALYIYLAQRLGLWEPLRNRSGTGGQDYVQQGVEFQYLFHRALGTFREPSHLAAWLAVTLIFLLPQQRIYKAKWMFYAVVCLTILLVILTGSLIGIIGILVGAAILAAFGPGRTALQVLALGGLVPILVLFSSSFGVDLVGAISPRIASIVEGGLLGTNRSYIYEFLLYRPPSIIGVGLGNGALIHSDYVGIGLISPIINLFLTTLYDSGLVGLVALVGFFVKPLSRGWAIPGRLPPVLLGSLAAHAAWVSVYFGMIPELSSYHAVMLGVFFGQSRLNGLRGRRKRVGMVRGRRRPVSTDHDRAYVAPAPDV